MMLEIDRFSLSFTDSDSGGSNHVVRDISLEINSGECVGLVGESGSGKSVTALSILRLLEESHPITTGGEIRFEGQNLLGLPLQSMQGIRGNRVSMIFQEPMTSLNPVKSIGSQLLEPLLMHRGLTRHQAEKEAISLLERTGISEGASRLSSFPHHLSGGQRQRVMIAMALACRPSLLIADEPTTALDVSIQAQILSLLAELQQEMNMAILLISHDLHVVRHMAGRLGIMQDGELVEQGITETIFASPAHPYTRKLLNALPAAKPLGHQKEPQLLLATEGLDCSFSRPGRMTSFLRREKITTRAVNNVSLQLYRGTTCGVIGESGSGKTTLGMAILKLVKTSGKVIFDGNDISNWSGRRMRPLRRKMQVVFQDPYSSLSPRMTIHEIVEEGLLVHEPSMSAEDRYNMVLQSLVDVGLEEDMAFRFPHEFSGGQRQRIAIARAMVLRPELLILDEPTSALDVTIQGQIIDLLQTLQQQYNLTYLFISHDLRVIRSISDYVAVMRDGAIIEEGPAEEIFTSPTEPYTKDLFSAALT